MDRFDVAEKFMAAQNNEFRFYSVKELVDALMECAIEETLNELDRRVGIAMKEHGLSKEEQE